MIGRVDCLEVFDCVFVAEGALHLEVDGACLVFLGELEAEGVEGEDGDLFGAVAESVLGDEGPGGVIEFVAFNLVLGESSPEADVDHHVPSRKVQLLHLLLIIPPFLI